MRHDDQLASEDARQSAQHRTIKADVSERVHQDVAREVRRVEPVQSEESAELADRLKRKAVREVADTEAHVERGAAAARISQVVDYVFYLIYAFIGLAIVLEAFGARDGAGFKRFVDTVSYPFLAPFRGLLADPGVGGYQFMMSWVIALVVYMILHAAINGALRMVAHRKVEV